MERKIKDVICDKCGLIIRRDEKMIDKESFCDDCNPGRIVRGDKEW